MKVYHSRLKRDLRLSYTSSFMARDRETVDSAFAGDIVGVVDTGNFQIGDTITNGKKVSFDEMPRFSPECFARLSIKDPLKRRQMQKAVQQLAEELQGDSAATAGLTQRYRHNQSTFSETLLN